MKTDMRMSCMYENYWTDMNLPLLRLSSHADSSLESSGPFVMISLSNKANKHGDDAEQSRIMSACVSPNKLGSCLVVWFNKHSHRTDFPNDAENTEQVHGLRFSLLPVLFETWLLLCAFPTRWRIRARLRKKYIIDHFDTKVEISGLKS